MRNSWKLIISLVPFLVILAIVSAFTTQENISAVSTRATQGSILLTTGGNIGHTITTQENVDFTPLAVQISGTHLFIHLQALNRQTKTAILTTNSVIHRFYVMYTGNSKEVVLSPTNNDVQHPSLPATLNTNGRADGWLTTDITILGGSADVLIYKIAPFHTKKCRNPADQNTCQPATLYYGAEWILRDGLR